MCMARALLCRYITTVLMLAFNVKSACKPDVFLHIPGNRLITIMQSLHGPDTEMSINQCSCVMTVSRKHHLHCLIPNVATYWSKYQDMQVLQFINLSLPVVNMYVFTSNTVCYKRLKLIRLCVIVTTEIINSCFQALLS
jgi:hypothetical protein